MKLINNWRATLQAYSTWALGAVVAIPALWLQVPDELKALIPARHGEDHSTGCRGRPDRAVCRPGAPGLITNRIDPLPRSAQRTDYTVTFPPIF